MGVFAENALLATMNKKFNLQKLKEREEGIT